MATPADDNLARSKSKKQGSSQEPAASKVPSKKPSLSDSTMDSTRESAASGICEDLLKLAGPNLYRRNIFRVLSVNIRATSPDVRRKQKQLAMQRTLGIAVQQGSEAALALEPAPGDEEIQDALDRLNDRKQRLLDEIFWFWPTNGDPRTDEALIALDKGQIKQASDIWTGLVKLDGQGEMAAHNLAVFSHLVALDYEVKLMSGAELDRKQREKLAELWSRALSRWKQVISAEEFWRRVKDRVRELDDQKLTTGFVRRIRATLPKAILLINARIALSAAERGDAELAQRHIRLMNEAGYEDGLAEEVLREAMKPVRSHIKAAIDAAKDRWTSDARHGERHVRDLYKQATSLLATVDIILPPDNPTRQGMHDMVADAIFDGGVGYAFKTEKWKGGIELLKLAEQIAAGEAQRTKLSEQIEILRKRAAEGRDWCSSDYWTLPDETINLLESIRQKANSGDHDGAIRALVSLDPRIGGALRRCLAYCLNIRGVRIFNEALNEYSNTETSQVAKIMEKLRSASDSQRMLMLMRYPTPTMTSFMVPPCLCCGGTYYSSWINFKYKDIPLFMCSTCAITHNAEIEQQKRTLSGHVSTALEYVLLADEVDPGDSGIQENIKVMKKTAGDINCAIPSTKSIKKRLQGQLRRSRQEVLTAAADGVCYFCGTNASDASCGITVPMCSGETTVEMIFGKGTEYRYGDVVVPRCRRCRDEHQSLPVRIEQWEHARLAAGSERHFRPLVEAVEAARAAVKKAEEAQAHADDPRNFPALVAAEQYAERATRSTRARVEAERRKVDEAQDELGRAEKIGNECPQCGSGQSWQGNICRNCDSVLFRLSVMTKCCLAAPLVYAFIALVTGCGKYTLWAIVFSGMLAALMKFLQWQRRRQLGAERGESLLQKRNASLAQARQKMEKARHGLAAVEKETQPTLKVYEDAKKKLQAARDEAVAKAENITKEKYAKLQEALTRLKAAQDKAMAEYEKENPRPQLASGVKPEDTYLKYPRIQELRRNGWGFGSEPSGGQPAAEPSEVKGLKVHPKRTPQSEPAKSQLKGRDRILEFVKSVKGDDMVYCPICNAQCKAKNLIRHYDGMHPGADIPAFPVKTVKPSPETTPMHIEKTSEKPSESRLRVNGYYCPHCRGLNSSMNISKWLQDGALIKCKHCGKSFVNTKAIHLPSFEPSGSDKKSPGESIDEWPHVDGYKCPKCGSYENTCVSKTGEGTFVRCNRCSTQFINTATARKSAKGRSGAGSKTSGACPKCGFGYQWNGSSCGHCGYGGGRR